MKKNSIVILIYALSAVVIFSLLGIIFFARIVVPWLSDIPDFDDSDLCIERPVISSEENAFTHFTKASNALRMPKDGIVEDYLNGDSQNNGIISAVLAENEPAFELIKRGVQCHRCIGPEVISFDSNVSYLSSFRQLGALLAAKAHACRLAGRYSDAVNSCAIVIKFGSLIQNDSESLYHFMIANSILSRGFNQAQDIARDENVPLEELNRLSSELAKIGPAYPGFIRTVKGEYQITSNAIKLMKEGKFDIIDGLKDADNKRTSTLIKRKWISSVLFQQNKSKMLFAKLFRNAPHFIKKFIFNSAY